MASNFVSVPNKNKIPEAAASIVRNFIAGETISALKIVYMDNNRVYSGSSANLNTATAIGIAKTAAAEGELVSVLQYGLLEDASFDFEVTDLAFLSETGSLTTTAPEQGYLTRIGKVINNNSVLVLIETPITL